MIPGGGGCFELLYKPFTQRVHSERLSPFLRLKARGNTDRNIATTTSHNPHACQAGIAAWGASTFGIGSTTSSSAVSSTAASPRCLPLSTGAACTSITKVVWIRDNISGKYLADAPSLAHTPCPPLLHRGTSSPERPTES